MKRLLILFGGILGFCWVFQHQGLAVGRNFGPLKKPPEAVRQKQDPGDSEIALKTKAGEIPKESPSHSSRDLLSVPKPKKSQGAPPKDQEPLPNPLSSSTEPHSPSIFRLQQISFETLPGQIMIQVQASGGLSRVRQEKMVNPGRLVLEIPEIVNTTNLSITALTDHLVIPRIRLAQHPDRLRIIVDTVLMNFPHVALHKTDKVLTLKLEKTPEMMAEAKSRSDLFLAMQRNDREALLRMGSDDEGGILFNDQFRSRLADQGKTFGPRGEGVNVEAGAANGNRIVFMLDDRKEYKIFIEDTETPIHIRKIRPVFEVKGIQARLKQLGYDVGTEDGSMGPKTREALRQYQKDKGIPVTGTPNKKTQHALKNEFGY